MSEPEFIRLQRAFAAHLRDPLHAPPPGLHEERRLNIYRHAIYANVERFMRDNFPRIFAITPTARWESLVRDYLIRHVAGATAFVDVPAEFLDYLNETRAEISDPPFLAELAHFDWLETLVGADQRSITLDNIATDADLLAGIPIPNPLLRLLTYRYPVHAINSEYLPAAPPETPTRIAAFRDIDHRYGFLDLNGPTARLLELVVEQRGLRGVDLIALIADELGHADVSALNAAGGTILARMRARGAILGTARSTP